MMALVELAPRTAFIVIDVNFAVVHNIELRPRPLLIDNDLPQSVIWARWAWIVPSAAAAGFVYKGILAGISAQLHALERCCMGSFAGDQR
jgi:hypothetical protein